MPPTHQPQPSRITNNASLHRWVPTNKLKRALIVLLAVVAFAVPVWLAPAAASRVWLQPRLTKTPLLSRSSASRNLSSPVVAGTIYVDDSWVGTPANADPDGPGPATNFGVSSFATIQAGINAASPGDTVIVNEGTYAEQLTVNKALSILGPNAAINPNTGTRVGEATIIPTSSDPLEPLFGGPITVYLAVPGITFKGFTVDGDNPSLNSGVVFNGADVNAEFGIYGDGAGDLDAVVENNIVQNVGEIGIWLNSFGFGGTRNANTRINQNKVDNLLGAYGQGLRISDDCWADVTNNVATRVRNGIVIENYSGNVSTHPASIIDHNQVTSFRIGIRHNLHYVYNAPGFTISNNTVQSYVQSPMPSQVTTPTSYQGIRVESIQQTVAVTVQDNVVTGNKTAMQSGGYTRNEGLNVTDVSATSPNILFNHNDVRDFFRGVFHETPALPDFECNLFTGNTTGLEIDAAASNGLIAHQNNIFGNGAGMQNNSAAVVDATLNYWGRPSGPTAASNPGGTGDTVSTNVTLIPFLTAHATCAPVINYTINASAGTGGAISPTGAVTVAYGEGQAFNITPDLHYHIVDVLVDGGSVGAVSSYTFNDVVANHTISASFAITTHTITASAGANGSIAPAGAVIVNDGADQAFTITPNFGFDIQDVLVDSVSVGAVNSHTITNVTADHTISATFVACGNQNTVYVDDNWVGTVNGTDPDGAGPATKFGCDSFATIQNGVDGVAVGGTVNINAGTYNEDVTVNKAGVSLLGAGSGSVTVSGPIGGPGSTIAIAASNVTVAGMTITRAGNNTTDWNNGGLNSAGISISSQAVSNTVIRDNIITGNRSGIDINNSNGHTIRNNVIDSNRTGMIMRNQTDSLIVVENFITNNWTVGIVFLDATSGTNSPIQTAQYCVFSNNNMSGNWYGQIVDRQTGGSLPAPGANPKNFKGNWFGTTSPVVTTANSTEPAYNVQIPVAYGGSATPPGGQPDIEGPASANFQYIPLLQSGTDTNVETTPGRGTNGFQGVPNPAAIVVRSSSLKNWAQQHTTCGAAGTGSQSFVIGPPTAPIGEGSLQYLIGANGDSVESMRSPDYNGIRLDSLTQLGYSTYAATGGGQAPYMRLDVDNDNNGSLDDSLFFEPVYQNGGYATIFPETIPNQCGANPNCVTTGVWQTWNTLTGGWWSNVESAGGPPLISLARYAVEHPGARIINAGGFGGLRISTGCGAGAWDNFDGNTDDVNIGVSGANTRYDFEPLPRISIDDVTHNEGQTGTTTYTFTVSLSRDSDQTVTVSYETANDSATAPTDFTAIPPTVLTFNPGETNKTITVDVTADMAYEGTEQFFVNLSSPNAHAVIADGQGVGTITEDDTVPNFSIDDVTQAEGNPPGTTAYVFTVTKNGATALSSSVQFQTVDGAATVADNDYAANTGTLNFGPSDTTMQVTVQVTHDFKPEPDEAFTVNLFNAVGATISAANGTGTIQNDDNQPSVVYVDDNFTGPIGSDPDGAGPATAIGYDAFATIQEGINAVAVAGTVNINAGTYNEDVNVNKAGLSLLGAGAASVNVIGPIGGSGSTIVITGNNVTVAGMTITRAGNNTTDWNNPALKTAGISIQGQAISGAVIRDNVITQLRTGIDINNSNGHTVRNNVITDNRTGLIFRNQTDNLTVVENFITNNWTVGILFLDASGGSNIPVQTARHSTFSNNNLSGNWYGQIVDRQSGGSLPAPGTTNLKNFRGNWFGTASPVVTTANSTEPGYAVQIPVAFGGTATPPGGQPDIAGPASANFKIDPVLTVGTDTNIQTTPGRGTNGFQGVANTVVVEPSSLHGWVEFDDLPGTGTGSAGFEDGPGVAPLGTGSAFLTVDANGRHALGTAGYGGTRMDDITELKYWSYQNNNSNTVVANSLQFDVDYDLNDASNTFQGRLVFEPYLSGTPQQNVWQNWDALAGNWYGTRTTVTVNGVAGVAQPCQPASPCTWAQVLSLFPNAGVRNTATSLVLFKAGGPWAPGFDGNVDDFSIKVNTAAQTYDFEPNPHISINDVSQSEGNASTTSYDFTVTLSRASSSTVTVDYVTANDSAVAPGDFTALSTTQLVFNPGETSKPVTVLVNGDLTYEPDEQFFVNLSNPSANADITDDQGVGAIVNDDALPSFSIDDVTQAEGNPPGTTAYVFTVTKTGATALNSSVQFQTVNGSATVADNDYVANTGTLNFAPADTTMQVTVQVNHDFKVEPDEAFTVNLFGEAGATISAANGTGTIQNDDNQPSVVYVDDNFTGPIGSDPDGAGPATAIGYDAFATIQEGVTTVASGGTVNVYAGTYNEDVTISQPLSLLGLGSGVKTVVGPIGGSGSTIVIAASNVTVAGLTITRAGNNTTDWNNSGLNTAGISIQGQAFSNALIRDNVITQLRTGIDINNSNGHTIRNNDITDNRTGLIFRNQTDNMTVVENFITNNWTVGILFLDGSGGSNSPVQTALHSTFSNNNLSGNWYGQIVDRQTGGSLPAPGIKLKNFRGNWFGTASPVVTTANSTEPGYAVQIPVAFGGTATPPGGQPDIAGPASANFKIDPVLTVGTDTNIETTPGRGTNGFQGVANTVVVEPSSTHGWVFFDDFPGTGTGSGGFADGPGTAPLGAGSAFLTVDANGRHALGTTAYIGTRMDDITELKYWSYQNNNTNTAAAIALQFDIDYDLNDADNAYMGRLVFEPYISYTVQQGVWQNWDALAGKWYGTRTTVTVNGVAGVTQPCQVATPCTWAQVLASFPNAGVGNTPARALLFKAGGPVGVGGFNGNVDDFSLKVNTAAQTYDFEPNPHLSINDVSHSEGNASTTSYDFTVTLSRASSSTVTVDYVTANDTAVAPGDFTALSTTQLVFNPGETSKPVTVLVNGDLTYEPDEQFFVNLSNPSVTADITDNQGVGAIVNDDAPPSFSIDDVTHMEGDPPGTTSYVFTVTKSGPTDVASSVQFQTVNGAATVADNDYVANTGTLNFGASDTTMQVTVQVNHDFKEEPDEAFTVNLFGVVGATISDADGTGTIQNDDTTPTIVFVDDDFTGPIGSDPDGAGLATAIGYDAFATIQEGINGVASGGTVIVYAGNYKENPNVNKAVTLDGPNVDVAGSAARVGEANVITNGNQNAVFTVSSNNVTIDGFTVDGDDPLVTGGPLKSGEDANVLYGVRPSGAFNHVTVQNNIIKNAAIGFRGDGASKDNLVKANWFDSIGNFDFGYCVSLRAEFYADITDNKMTRAWTGVHINDHHLTGGPASFNISNNEIHSYAGGILYWLNYNDAVGATINANTITAESGAVANNFGMLVVSLQTAVSTTITGNTISGHNYGVGLFNVPTTSTITLGSTNSISDSSLAGVFLTDNLNFNPVGTTNFLAGGPGAVSTVNVSGLSISGNTGDGVKVEGGTNAQTLNVSGSTITGTSGTKGVELVSPQSFINLTASTVTGFSTGVALGNSSGATAHFNRIISGTTAIDNPNNKTANLENNWWGCNAGPGNTGCGAVNGTGADFNPWIVLGVSASPSSISSGGTSTVTADMTRNSDGNVPVGSTTLPLPNAAFTATNGTILPASNSFTAGQSQSTFTSTSSADGQGCAAVDNQPAVCATINVGAPAFSINDVTHLEGNPPGTTAYVFTVTKTGTTALSSSVQFQTVDGSATVADNDYTSNTGTLNFGPSDTTMQVTVQVTHDFKPESDEAFTVNLFNPVGASISDADGTGTIQTDDNQPNVVYVDDGFTGSIGSDPDGAGPATAIGYDAFKTIQEGVNAVAANGTVNVYAGNYPENVTVPKSLSVLGPNSSVDPNTGTRVAEAVVRPAVTETSVQTSTSGTIFRLGSGSGHIDVTVKGLTIDGNNSTLTGGRTLNGVQVHTGAGIVNSVGSFDTNPGAYDVKMIVQYNIIRNLERYGVLVDNVPARTPSAGNDVSFNLIDNLPSGNNFTGERGRGIAFEENVYGSATFNVIKRVNVGWQDDNYNLPSPGAGTLVDHNEIHAYHRGIFHNLQYQSATAASITNNQLFAETNGDFPASTTNFGLELASIQSAVGVTVTSNSSTGNVYGILLWNLPTTSTITVSGGTLTGNQYGVLATMTDPQFGAGSAGHVVISGVTVSGATGAGMAADGAGASMEVAGSTITGSAKGVVIRNGAVGNSITGNSIHDNTGLGIDLADDGITANDPNDVDSGPNNLQNFPIIGTALVGSPNTISGTLNSTPGQAFTIHLYANPTCDSSGNGEGQTSIGSTTANTDGSGNAIWALNPVSLTVGNFITATATDSAGNTSEFSACFQARAFAAGTIAFNQVSNSETNGDHNVDVIVSRTVGSDGAVSVQYNVTDGTATLADNDYSVAAPSGTLTWADGDASDRLITISVKGDSKFEADETVLLTLSNPTGGASTGGTNPALTITNDDSTPSFSIDDVTHNEGNGGTTAYVFTVTKTGTTALNAGVNFQTADNSATLAGSDYQAQTGSLTFLPADTTKTVTVLVNGDTNVEPDEAFFLNLSGATNASITDNQGVGTITNDDTDVTLSVSAASVNEDDATNLVYTFTRNGNTTGALTANFTVAGSATFGTDYTQTGAATFTATTGTVTFAAGNSTATVTIDPSADVTVESDETVVLTLTGGTGYSIGTLGAVTSTITNDDADVSVAVSPATALEDGATNLVYTFTRNGNTTGALTANFTVAGGATFGTDYTQTGAATFTATTGSVTFAAGNSTASVTIDPSTDVTVESDETVALTLTAGTGYNVATPSVATGTITNDDTDVSVAVSPASVLEDGATNLVYTFTRNGNTTGALTANFSVTGSATFGTDYTQTGAAAFTTTSGSVTFAAGNSTATVTIDPSTDATVEPDETVVLTLTSGTGYNVASPSVATSTITNDDTDVSVAVAPATVLEDGATNLVYTFTRNGNTTGTLTANFSVAGGATFNTDYTQTGAATFTATTGSVTFAAGNSTATVTIDPSTDTTVESDETVILTVTSGTGYNVATPGAATGTITNDDADVTLSVSPASVNEDGATNLVYTFTRNGNTTGALTANFSVAGSATFNTDYTQTGAATFTATTGSVTFAAASSTATVTIDPSADTTVESDETVILTVVSGTGYNVATPSAATGTITNDEGDVSVAVSPATVPEDGAANLVYTFTRGGVNTGSLTVNFNVAGTATFNSDYSQSGAATFTTTNGTVTFAAGSSTATVTVDPTTDVTVEPDETVILTVASGTGYSVGSPSAGTGTIVNDDGTTGGSLQFSAASYNVGEGSFFTTITVRRLGDTTGAVSVDYATPDDSAATTVIPCETASGIASPRCDFTTAVGTLHWAAGDSAPKTFVVLISEDDYVEGPEALTLTLSNPTGGAHLGSPATASLTINDDATEPTDNPIDGPPDFVRQHYHDFLNREPDQGGFDFWVGNFPPCNGDPQCIEVKRINVSASFYLSIEFQGTGYFVERLYKTSYGDATGTSTIGTPHTLPVPIVKFSEFLPDTQEIGRGVVVLAPGWEEALEANKVAFTEQFVQRARFLSAYPLSMTPAQFVDALNANAGNPLSTAERNQLVSDLTGGAKTRAQVLRAIADDQDLINAEFNRGFVLMQYFGFLRRNPNAAPDLDHSGYDFWLQKLNQFNGNFVEAEMVKAFLTSIEYRARSGRN